MGHICKYKQFALDSSKLNLSQTLVFITKHKKKYSAMLMTGYKSCSFATNQDLFDSHDARFKFWLLMLTAIRVRKKNSHQT